MNLAVVVGPTKPVHITEILSSPLPILFDFKKIYGDMAGRTLWRMRAVLEHHHDRVRQIAFDGSTADFKKLLTFTNRPFPVLESLTLWSPREWEIPNTFLRGPDLSDLPLRNLSLILISFSSIFGILSSLTSLTHICLLLQIDTAINSSSGTTLLTCLQCMPCLQYFCLAISSSDVEFPSQTPTPKDIIPLSKLVHFSYTGHSVLLEVLVAGLSAPSLRSVNIKYYDMILPPIVHHLSRFINEIIEEQCHAVCLAFKGLVPHLLSISLFTRSEYIPHKPRFRMSPPRYHPESIMRISGALSRRLSTVEELRITFEQGSRLTTGGWVDDIPWRRFLQKFPSVKAIRAEGGDSHSIARIFLQDLEEPDDGVAFLPALEEIELEKDDWLSRTRQNGPELAAFQPFVSARQQAGRPVKVFFRV